MTRFRVKYYGDDCGDGCCYIIQKKKLFFWIWYDKMLYTKEEALERLEYIRINYPNVKSITNIIKEIELPDYKKRKNYYETKDSSKT